MKLSASTLLLRRVAPAGALICAGFLLGRLSMSPSAPFTVTPASIKTVSGSGGVDRSGIRPGAEAGASISADAGTKVAVDPRARLAELRGQPGSAARERAMAECLRLLAATDPQGALALAREEPNFRVRQDLVVASLQGWAGHDPAASLGWASENLFETNRRGAVEAIIDAGLPLREETMEAVRALCGKSDSAAADDYGRMLIAALAREADFTNALAFAADERSPSRDYWIGAALYSWSQYRPEEAAAALEAFADPATRNEGMHGLILGWGANQPESLVEYARRLPPGPLRTQAFDQALQNWVAHDPVAASAWLDKHESDPELDSGAAKLATSPFLVANEVETALGWAKSVSDPEQRSIALLDVMQQWAGRDPAAALAYVDKLPEMQPAYRDQLMKSLAAAGGTAAPPPRAEP